VLSCSQLELEFEDSLLSLRDLGTEPAPSLETAITLEESLGADRSVDALVGDGSSDLVVCRDAKRSLVGVRGYSQTKTETHPSRRHREQYNCVLTWWQHGHVVMARFGAGRGLESDGVGGEAKAKATADASSN
jgi:hypothetical protein